MTYIHVHVQCAYIHEFNCAHIFKLRVTLCYIVTKCNFVIVPVFSSSSPVVDVAHNISKTRGWCFSLNLFLSLFMMSI